MECVFLLGPFSTQDTFFALTLSHRMIVQALLGCSHESHLHCTGCTVHNCAVQPTVIINTVSHLFYFIF